MNEALCLVDRAATSAGLEVLGQVPLFQELPAIIESGEVAAEEAIPAIRAALAPA
jgi:hypothetical protein